MSHEALPSPRGPTEIDWKASQKVNRISFGKKPKKYGGSLNLDPEGDIPCFLESLLYDNSSPRPPEALQANSNAIESLPPSHIPGADNDSLMEEIDLFLADRKLINNTTSIADLLNIMEQVKDVSDIPTPLNHEVGFKLRRLTSRDLVWVRDISLGRKV
ncbi:hypothetical protein Tco_1376538 [Tanacetum coccineum]